MESKMKRMLQIIFIDNKNENFKLIKHQVLVVE